MEIMQILKANSVADERHHRHPVQSGGAPAGHERGAPRCRTAGVRTPAAPAPPPGARAPAPAPAPVPAPPPPSTAQRLQELETLRATGTITDAEYTAKRQQIISDL